MIRLSRLTDYGIVLMAHLAEQGRAEHAGTGPGAADGPEEGVTRNAREVSTETGLPLPVVSKILKSLARAGLLVSQRGAKGGYALARPAESITVPEMISVLEGPIALTECTQHPGACAQEHSCHVREPWQRINQAVHHALEGITLADLVAPEPGDLIPLSSLGVDPAGIEPPPS